MKRKYLYSLLFCVVLFSSCNKWLTVEPPTQTTADKLFQTSGGFSDALTGLYMGLRDNYKPDQFMLSGGVDNMACLYTTSGDYSGEHALFKHDYTNSYADQKLSLGFLNQYKVIANANILLDAVAEQTILKPEFAKLIEGEARAIRAFAHFDLIRIWGPIPGHQDNRLYLPYVMHRQTTPYTYESYETFMSKLLDDLNQAEILLAKVDPIVKYSNESLNISSPGIADYLETYWYYRQNRINYFAVLALKARYYQWMGEKSEAFKYAKMVADAKNEDGSTKFKFADRNTFNSLKDYTMFPEQVFGIHVETFDDAAFTGNRPTFYTSEDNINSVLFDNTNDLRKETFFSSVTSISQEPVMRVRKFSNMRLTTFTSSFSIPLIRLSEMYLILAETGNQSEANAYYQKYRTAKEADLITLPDGDRQDLMVKEYTRELFGEGQTFYLYKRMNLSKILFSTETMGEKEYVPTLPIAEINPFN